eukprot:1704505-Pleurochrysis_carterae.AAC.1
MGYRSDDEQCSSRRDAARWQKQNKIRTLKSEEELRLANLLETESSFRRDMDRAGLAGKWGRVPNFPEDVLGVAPIGSPEHGIPKTWVGPLVIQNTAALSQRAPVLFCLRPQVERSDL